MGVASRSTRPLRRDLGSGGNTGPPRRNGPDWLRVGGGRETVTRPIVGATAITRPRFGRKYGATIAEPSRDWLRVGASTGRLASGWRRDVGPWAGALASGPSLPTLAAPT